MATDQIRKPVPSIEATHRKLSTAEFSEHAVRKGEGIISAMARWCMLSRCSRR